jgi:hypothetical protein
VLAGRGRCELSDGASHPPRGASPVAMDGGEPTTALRGEPSRSAPLVPSSLGRCRGPISGSGPRGVVRPIRQVSVDAHLLVGPFVCEEDRASPSPLHGTARIPPRGGDGARGAEGRRNALRAVAQSEHFPRDANPIKDTWTTLERHNDLGSPPTPGSDGLAQVSHKIIDCCKGEGKDDASLPRWRPRRVSLRLLAAGNGVLRSQ